MLKYQITNIRQKNYFSSIKNRRNRAKALFRLLKNKISCYDGCIVDPFADWNSLWKVDWIDVCSVDWSVDPHVD